MKKLAAILCLSSLATGAFAQGLIQFANGPTTLISYSPAGNTAAIPASTVGSYFYGLLIGSSAAGPFTFANVLATNTAAGSKMGPATYQPAVTGWAAGATMFYEVAGWSSSLGTTFNNSWLTGNVPKPANDPVWGTGGFFGLSSIASGVATASPAPPFPLFGGTGLPGFVLGSVGSVVPEPSSMALAGLGAAALLIFRRRK